MKLVRPSSGSSLVVAASLLAACSGTRSVSTESTGTNGEALSLPFANQPSYQLSLSNQVRFEPIQPGSDATHGRQLFGLAADLETSDPNDGAIIQGPSVAYGGTVVSNGRTCFTCHRGQSTRFGFLPPPLSASVPLTDPLFTGIDADTGGDPDGMYNLDQLALIRYRPNRFNLARTDDDPFKQVFGWRKSIQLVNVAFAHGLLGDGRARDMFETDRGAFFSHTQNTENRFDDLFPPQDGNDLAAFQFTQMLSDPRLAALRDPSDPTFKTLVNNPFYTVSVTTPAQIRGQLVFVQNCMSCHNTPNVFDNLANVEALGSSRPVTDPAFAPSVGMTFDVGVAERNKFKLRFTRFVPPSGFAPIVLPLANEDGTTSNFNVTYDPGLAMTTGRSQDIGRFKVPQLRGVAQAGPYFHDNSAATLEEVVDYFNGPQYAASRDGSKYPIHFNARERADLLEFLKVL